MAIRWGIALVRIHKTYSHLNGEEYLLVHKPGLYSEIRSVIESINAEDYKTKISKEKRKEGNALFSPIELNRAFSERLSTLGWEGRRRDYYVSDKYEIVKVIETMTFAEQKEYLIKLDEPLIYSFNQTDFVKEGVAVEIQLGKYFAVAFDLFVKHLAFYNAGVIDVGVEVLPSKILQEEMSSGPPFFEKEVHNVLRHGRNSPAVPIVMIGISP